MSFLDTGRRVSSFPVKDVSRLRWLPVLFSFVMLKGGLLVTNSTVYLVSSANNSAVISSQPLNSIMTFPQEKGNAVVLIPPRWVGIDPPTAMLAIATRGAIGFATTVSCQGFTRRAELFVNFSNVAHWDISYESSHVEERYFLSSGLLVTLTVSEGVPMSLTGSFEPPTYPGSATLGVRNIGFGLSTFGSRLSTAIA
jgi:hypothetical protein